MFRRVRQFHEREQLQHVLHALHSADGRHCHVRRYFLQRIVSRRSEALLRCMHSYGHGLQRELSGRNS